MPDTQTETLTQRLNDELAALKTQLLRLSKQQNLDLPPTQASLIRQLKQAPMTIGELASSEALSMATVSRCVDRLEERNLVWRARDKHDRRIVYVVARREAISLLEQQPGLSLPDLSSSTVKDLQRLCDSVADLNRLLRQPR